MSDELGVALDLCARKEKVRLGNVGLLRAEHNARPYFFLKTGVGPVRSASSLKRLLQYCRPSGILGIGYAGALSADLRLGDLTVVRKASLLAAGAHSGSGIHHLDLAGTWELAGVAELQALAQGGCPPIHAVEILTSPFVIGDPGQKSLLGRRFRAQGIDMETAALAKACAERGIPFSCVRAISDDAEDAFLAPFSYDPSANTMNRALKVASAGHWIKRLQKWRENSAVARQSLRKFLILYLDSQETVPHLE